MEKSKLMMIIIIVLLVVLLGTVGFVAFYVLNLIGNQNQAEEQGTVGYDVTKEVKLEDTINVAIGDEIITNLEASVSADGGKTVKHNVRLNAYFRYDGTADESEAFTALLAEPGVIDIARSLVVDCLNSVTAEEVETVDGKSMLADTIQASLQDEFDTNLIVDVYFSNWIVT